MPSYSPGLAKNLMRRALRAILDAEPSRNAKVQIWKYFNSSCAYCERTLKKESREGHIDHLISRGGNHISNRVLSCGSCNGDRKREMDWEKFLRETAPSLGAFKRRRARILAWRHSNRRAEKQVIEPVVQEEIDRAILAFDKAVKRLRQLRQEKILASV